MTERLPIHACGFTFGLALQVTPAFSAGSRCRATPTCMLIFAALWRQRLIAADVPLPEMSC